MLQSTARNNSCLVSAALNFSCRSRLEQGWVRWGHKGLWHGIATTILGGVSELAESLGWAACLVANATLVCFSEVDGTGVAYVGGAAGIQTVALVCAFVMAVTTVIRLVHHIAVTERAHLLSTSIAWGWARNKNASQGTQGGGKGGGVGGGGGEESDAGGGQKPGSEDLLASSADVATKEATGKRTGEMIAARGPRGAAFLCVQGPGATAVDIIADWKRQGLVGNGGSWGYVRRGGAWFVYALGRMCDATTLLRLICLTGAVLAVIQGNPAWMAVSLLEALERSPVLRAPFVAIWGRRRLVIGGLGALVVVSYVAGVLGFMTMTGELVNDNGVSLCSGTLTFCVLNMLTSGVLMGGLGNTVPSLWGADAVTQNPGGTKLAAFTTGFFVVAVMLTLVPVLGLIVEGVFRERDKVRRATKSDVDVCLCCVACLACLRCNHCC
jgi:hypothetical protein